ncbi:unnamed protein product [Arabis nemorensis]|uniref:DUF4378 domain-containing protein n=1 Tax=Arabis nemorensis TaxID=586526 RepID=A0A565AKU2_9BRAS|nr:unnamed protein product [Arabis nemorensis]
MRKLKHSFKKGKPQHGKRLFGKTRRKLQRSVSTKEHFFLERMTSISQKRTHQEHYDKEKHLTEMLNNGDFDQNLATSKQIQTRIVSLPEYLSPFSSPGRIWNQNSTVLLRSASDEISKVEAYDEVLKKASEAKRQPLCNQLEGKIHHTDEKQSVFKYVKAVLDAVDSNWEELYLKTEFSDQLLKPALISNIPFYPNQICNDHELLFDCINEVLFEFCRFPQWVSFVKPRTQVFSFSVESIIHKVQKEVYCRLLPSRLAHSVDQIVKEDMSKPRNWLDIRCDLECIGFETSELILNELLEELMLDLCREGDHPL